MNVPENHNTKGRVSFRLLTGIAILGLFPALLWAQSPQWWTQRGVQNTNPANDYAAVNQGQVKNIATAAIAELDSHLPGGAGDILHGLALQLSGTSAQTNDYAAVNLGQLKTVAAPFYDRLINLGYATQYPWTTSTNAANDYAMANIGQVKNLFSFNVCFPPNTTDADYNGLPDDWEIQYFGGTGTVQADGIDPASGLTYLQEYLQGRTPKKNPTPDTGGGVVNLQVFTPLQ